MTPEELTAIEKRAKEAEPARTYRQTDQLRDIAMVDVPAIVTRCRELEAARIAGQRTIAHQMKTMEEIETERDDLRERRVQLEARLKLAESDVALAVERLGPAGWKMLERMKLADVMLDRLAPIEVKMLGEESAARLQAWRKARG